MTIDYEHEHMSDALPRSIKISLAGEQSLTVIEDTQLLNQLPVRHKEWWYWSSTFNVLRSQSTMTTALLKLSSI